MTRAPSLWGDRRPVKIVASIGAQAVAEERVGRLIAAGANLVRMSVADDEPDRQEAVIAAVRAAAHNARNPIGVVGDLGTAADGVHGTSHACEIGVDILVVPAASSAEEVGGVVAQIPEGRRPLVFASIESRAGVAAVDEILIEADGLLVDLTRSTAGIDPAEVPVLERRLARRASADRRPCLVATGSRRDAALTSVVLTGADGLVVDGADDDERAAAVTDADRVARFVDPSDIAGPRYGGRGLRRSTSTLLVPAIHLAQEHAAKALVVLPTEGAAALARSLSAIRPTIPIVGMCDSLPHTLQLSPYWGVLPRFFREGDLSDADGVARTAAQQLGLAQPGDTIVVVDAHRPALSILSV